jgi:hypothetical protein
MTEECFIWLIREAGIYRLLMVASRCPDNSFESLPPEVTFRTYFSQLAVAN